MPADKLGEFRKCPGFMRRANAAVTKSIVNLEAKGTNPVYGPDPPASDVRKTKDTPE